jgi:hypothetical protein
MLAARPQLSYFVEISAKIVVLDPLKLFLGIVLNSCLNAFVWLSSFENSRHKKKRKKRLHSANRSQWHGAHFNVRMRGLLVFFKKIPFR